MSNFYFYIISSFHSRCSETRVVGLINTVIIVTYFGWGYYSVFEIIIVTCECAVSKLQTVWSYVCHQYYYTYLTVLLFILRCSEPRVVVLINVVIIATYFD